ncbi:hypothetical protein BO94DRAFT_550592 [Aspergillus sclerotioniger CBS 115572]|uniref:Uncharacterized protein n=1 Tax=Aspergillus sclerotioniger CBS 115572 TaxID=1450535 RepID=A0A317V9L9_9EURO|nr:hypothetical protein BO94DRAFT_550592 [Aspergillus sclerotioniger CBS 115572]PWY70886.1 hypothetical protein BO94DRAFT_550592 [Aspergillus sclerotioniger CBS 115572]
MAKGSSQNSAPRGQGTRRLTALLNGETADHGDITREQFHDLYKQDPERTFDVILNIMNELESETCEIAQERDAIQKERDQQALQIIDLTKERDSFAVQITRQAVNLDWGASSSETKKSMKIPDPPMFGDGKDITLEDWILVMRQK